MRIKMAREDTQTKQLGEESAVHQIRDDLAGHEDTIRQLVSAIRDQIHDSDERHTGVLSNMQQRLGSLTTDVQDIRQRIPENLSGNLERLEQGLDTLSDRVATIAAHYDEPADASLAATVTEHHGLGDETPSQDDSESESEPPAALRSREVSVEPEISPQTAASAASSTTDIDTFDMVETSLPGDPSSPWDRDTAEVLSTVYDDEDTINQFKAEEPAPSTTEPPVRTPDPEAPAEPASFYSADDVQAVTDRSPSVEREWLEAKFSEIAERIEASLSDFNPEQTYHQISERFDDFEQRLGNALVDVATQSDLGPLRDLEAQLGELTSQLTATESNMKRLDSIEGHLSQVSSQLGDGAAALTDMPQPSAIDPEQLAEAAAARVAEHLSAAGLGAAGGQVDDASVQEVRGLVEGLMSESREGNEQTSMMLDTMQQAMMRILDRLDALEVSQYQAAAPAMDTTLAPPVAESFADDGANYGDVEAAASGWQDGSDLGQLSDAETSQPQAFDDGSYQDADVGEADVEIHATGAEAGAEAFDAEPEAQPEAPAYPSHDLISHGDDAVSVPAEPKASSRDAIEKIRHNFIRDAQRAKEQAAAEAAQADLEEPAKKGRKRRSVLSTTTTEPSDGQTGGMFGSKTRRLLVGALVAVILINGALYLMPRGKGGDAPKDPASISKQEKLSPEKKATGSQEQSSLIGAEDLLHRAVSDESMEAQVKEALVDAHHRAAGSLELPFGLTLQQSSADEWTGEGRPSGAVIPAALTGSDTRDSGASTKASKTLKMPHPSVGPHSLRLAASKGDASAQFEVATRLAEAKGTEQDIDQAVAWFKRSAAQGFAQSQYRLGTLYERGLGVKKDAKRAKIWYLRSAEQGNIKAMHNLAVLSAGQSSGSPDYATAAQWFLKAAERGLADSQFNVGVLFENGLGVAQDSNAAYKWYSLAARTGDKEAMKRSQKLRSSLPIDELSEAEKLVRSFVAKAIDPVINNARLAGQEWKKRSNS
jgi:localization factor PodJL